MSKFNRDASSEAIESFLAAIGHRDHPEVKGTGDRVSEMWAEQLLSGYEEDPSAILRKRIVDESGSVVLLSKIPFHGTCPHHLVPFFGDVDLAYEPDGFIVGLGALEHLVASLSRRLTLQEELTGHLVDHLMQGLDAKGAACRIKAQHLCFMLRGREPRATEVVTYGFRGSLDGVYSIFDQQDPVDDERGD